ncbi:MAG: site-2 protease family protein [Candidatus Lokiarchaeota archaeon]|nr:site-2 protease family protein [Candidatus Lokiarchaeota archaeon]
MPLFNNPILDFLLNPLFISSLLFWLIVLGLAYLLRKKKGAAYLFFPLLAMFKTKKLNKFIKKISKKSPKFWKIFWTIGIFISFALAIYAFYFFFTNFINLIVAPRPEQAIVPLIPGVTVDLPFFFYMILPLLFIVTTHEFAHGIAASADGIDVKSTGVIGAGIFFIFLYGAFVEIDEREVNSTKFKRNTRLRIAAAGTFVNAITAGIAFILLLTFPLIIAPWYRQVTQVNSVLTDAQGGFNEGKLANGDVILAIKKQGALDTDYVSLDDNEGRTLGNIFDNKTSLKCSIGDNLTFRIYKPSSDVFSEKNVTLGPRYFTGILYDYISDTELEITKIYSESEGGNNFNTNLTEGLIISKINGELINVTEGDTLGKALTIFDLKILTLSTATENYTLNVNVTGIVIGIFSNSYFMYKNAVAKFFTSFWPVFLLNEIFMLFLIAFSITLFNMLPLPIFDGGRIFKELINWGIGEDYKTKRKKKDKFYFKDDEKDCELSEYRVDKINSIEIVMDDQSKLTDSSRILLAEEKYKLIDKIGDGFKDTVSLNLPDQKNLPEGSRIEITYDYYYDEKKKTKRIILSVLQIITLIIILGSFILSFVNFGGLLFWI